MQCNRPRGNNKRGNQKLGNNQLGNRNNAAEYLMCLKGTDSFSGRMTRTFTYSDYTAM